ncbi:MAG: hypothetical protein AAF799_15915 [Myxococcota bacterium]
MRCWTALLTLALFVPTVGCQRLPGEEDDDDGSGAPPPPSGGTFLPQDDTGDGEPSNDESGEGGSACDPVTQSGCEMDEKCTALVVGGVVTYGCVADPGGLDPSDPCVASHSDGIDGCGAGYACLADEGDNGLCTALCENHSDCSQGECLPARESDIPYCADDCSPFGSLCPAPLQCRRNDNRFSCAFIGINDVGGSNSPCAVTDDAGCAPGFVCVPGSLAPDCMTDNCCVPLCDVTEDDLCASPSTCTEILQGPAPGFEDIGACFVPA